MTFYTHTRPRARRRHECVICYRAIEPGETYLRGFGAEARTVWTWKECAHCEAFRTLADVAQEDEYGRNDYEEFEPYTVAEARWLVQWKRQWRRRDGQMYPLPGSDA